MTSAFPGFHFSLKAVARRTSEYTWGNWGALLPTVEACLRQEPQMPISNMPHVYTVATSSRFVLSPTNESSKGRKVALSGRSFVPFSLFSWSIDTSPLPFHWGLIYTLIWWLNQPFQKFPCVITGLSRGPGMTVLDVFLHLCGKREVILPPWLTHQGKAGPPFLKVQITKKQLFQWLPLSLASVPGRKAVQVTNNWLALHKQ